LFILRRGVARGLNCTRGLQRDLGVVELRLVEARFAFEHEAALVAVGGDVVEAVVMHAHVGNVRRHVPHRLHAAALEHRRVAGRVEMQERHAELEALRPLGPAARSVFALHGEHRGALAGVPGGVDGADFSPASSNTRAVFFVSLAGVRVALIFMAESEETHEPAGLHGKFFSQPSPPARIICK